MRLAELHRIRALLRDAVVMVNVGWIQNAWFAVVDDQGGQRKLTAHEIHEVDDRPVSGACLVGGIVHAAGGPDAAHSQLVQRTLDLTWHSLYEGAGQPVRWCPSPAGSACASDPPIVPRLRICGSPTYAATVDSSGASARRTSERTRSRCRVSAPTATASPSTRT